METYQQLFHYGPYVHYLVFHNDTLLRVCDNAKDVSKIIIDEPNCSPIKIKELYVNKYWRNYKKNMKVYETINKHTIKHMKDIMDIYLNNTNRVGVYELLFLKFMLNPELLVRNEKLVHIVKVRLNEYKRKCNLNMLPKSDIMKQFEIFLKHALRRYDSYCYRPYNLRSKK